MRGARRGHEESTNTFCFNPPTVLLQVTFWRHAKAVIALVRALRLAKFPLLRWANRSSCPNSRRSRVMMLAGRGKTESMSGEELISMRNMMEPRTESSRGFVAAEDSVKERDRFLSGCNAGLERRRGKVEA
jgi:hypothetical protein